MNTNFRNVMESHHLTAKQRYLISEFQTREVSPMSLEFPSGPVALDSNFYISRPPMEALAYNEITEPGSVIRIKAASKMGKSSLMLRILAVAQQENYRIVNLDFQQADKAVFTNLDKFLRWFCINISRELQIESKLDDYWDEDIGSKVSCTIYFQGYLLKQISTPLVLALNEVNRVFEYPDIAQDFLPLLRYWYEQAKKVTLWQKLRMIVAYSTEIYIPLNLNQSPFNIGLPLKLPPFTLEQIQDLAHRHQLNWIDFSEAKQLMAMVGGHPYLVRLALYHLVNPPLLLFGNTENWGNLEQLLQAATTESGIYNDHLRGIQTILQQYPQLALAVKELISTKDSIKLDPIIAYKLDSMGLVTLDGDRCTISCNLYRLYFSSQILTIEESSPCHIHQLETETQRFKKLCSIDSLNLTEHRRCMEDYLHSHWKPLARIAAPLSIIICEIDDFKVYNKVYGNQHSELCLQQIAKAIKSCLPKPSYLLSRYDWEKFMVILPEINGNETVNIAEKIRRSIKHLAIPFEHFNFTGFAEAVVTVSLGVASIIPNLETANNPSILLVTANEALYQSKRTGRDCVTLSSILL